MYNFRTDLAVERNDIYKKVNNIQSEIDGIEIENESREETDISRVKIINEDGENKLGKPIGNYITLDVKQIKLADEERLEEIAEIVAREEVLRDEIDKIIAEIEG